MKPWWQTTTIYQIYPRSFMDSNNDGIGDLPGIISRLDYVADIGFETIWLSPFYASPQQDFGYDISDYYSIAPEYGTMEDVETLIAEVHRRGMRIVFDMIFGHTSIEHSWFQESRISRDNPRADWYIWRDGRRGRPPNNWKSITGVNGWQYEPLRDQWYYTNFLHFQPDLNFRNPRVKEAMFDAVRFWLEKGVDGFRLDIFHAIYKDDQFRDNPFSFRVGQPVDSNDGANQVKKYTMNLPENVELARELRQVTDRWSPECVLIGEVFGEHEVIRRYLERGAHDSRPGLHAIFLFEMLTFRFSARFFRAILRKFEMLYPDPLIPTLVLGNHDRPRWISRINGNRDQAKCIALLQLTARGIPVIYYGEEIGMEEGDFPFQGALDPIARQFAWLPRWVARAMGLYLNRDGCRTPMQWDDSCGAGFSETAAAIVEADSVAEPWLPVNPDYRAVNVKTQRADPDSLLNLYRELLRLRKSSIALREGDFELLENDDIPPDVVAYRRGVPSGESVCVAVNFGKRAAAVPFTNTSNMVFHTSSEVRLEGDTVVLPPATGVVTGSPVTP